MNVKRITIKGESGGEVRIYEDTSFEKFSINANSISYEWKKRSVYGITPDKRFYDFENADSEEIDFLKTWEKESKWESHKKWSYRSENPEFHTKFQMISEELKKIIEDGELIDCCDANMYEFILSWEDGSKTSMSICSMSEYFPNLFTLIEQLIPNLELASYRKSSVFSLCDDEEDDDAEKDEEDENNENGLEKIDEE